MERLLKNPDENSKKTTQETKNEENKLLYLVQIKEDEKTLSQMLAETGLKVGDCMFGSDFNGKINEKHLQIGINRANNGYYLYTPEAKTRLKSLIRLSDYSYKLVNKLKINDYNNPDSSEHKYELALSVNNSVKNIIVSISELRNLIRFEEKISKYAHFNSIIEEKQHKIIVANVLSEECPTITEFKTAGLNIYEGKPIFVTENNFYSYSSTNNVDVHNVRLSSNALLKPIFIDLDTILQDESLNISEPSEKKVVSYLLKSLFDMLDKAYNHRIEPYLVISVAFMILFLKQINSDFSGIPIVALYGEAASGKTNLLRLIAYAFGLNEKVLHGGMDTLAGIIEDLEEYVNIPLLIDEVELSGIDEVKRLTKSVYDQTGRKKHNYKNNINTTLFYNTNHRFLHDLEYKNRCLEVNFEQADFNKFEAEKFNKLQQYLSIISAFIIKTVPYENIKTAIKSEERSDFLCFVDDNRIQRNLAIAITGFKLLLNLINDASYTFEKYTEQINAYISNVLDAKNANINQFIAILKELIDEKRGKLTEGVDYKLQSTGIHISTGKYGKTFEIHFKKLYEAHFRGIKMLDIKAYEKLLKQNGAEMQNVHYSPSIGTR